MKYLPIIASVLLGLVFLLGSVPFFLHLYPDQKFPEGAPIAHFMSAFMPTGYMHMVKAFELIGAILVLIPKTRNFGLLVLGPIVVNILAFAIFIDHSAYNPLTFVAAALALYLLWDARQKFAGLLN